MDSMLDRERCARCQVGQGRNCACRDASENLRREEDDQSQGLEFSLAARVWLTLIGAVAASAGLVWLADMAREALS